MEQTTYILTAEQIVEIRDAFEICDPQKTGIIHSKDLGTVLRALGQNPTESETYRFIEGLDEFNRGTITLDSFIQLMTRIYQMLDKNDFLLAAFKSFTRDGSAFISSGELRNTFANLGERMSDTEFEEMFREIDIDGDGYISWRDFIIAFKN